MSNLHRDVDEANNHNAKGFTTAGNGTFPIKNEDSGQVFERLPMYPAAINFVDGHNAPPTTTIGDIYVLLDLGNGAVDNGWLGATGAGTNYNSWVRLVAGTTIWKPFNPVEGQACINKNDGYIWIFDGTTWNPFAPIVSWGNIQGTLSNQTDLQTALNSAGQFEVGTGTDSAQQKATSNNASGNNSVAMGNSSTASGLGSISVGWACQSIGTRSFTTGFVCIANNIGAVAMGESVTVSGNYGIGSGQSNTISGINGVAFGIGHTNSANYAGILSGDNGVITATSQRSIICGGSLNYINGIYSVISGGGSNQINANYCSIAGGQNNNTSAFANTHIIGSNLTADKANYTFVENLNVKSGGFLVETTGASQVLKTTNSSKIGFYTATPVTQPTTGITASTFTANTSGIADDTATFDGYTIGQVVAALRNLGILA